MVTLCKDGSYVIENHSDLESIQNHLGAFAVSCVVEASKLYCGEADVLLMDGKVKTILHKDRILVENEGMAWQFLPEKGWELLGMY